MKILRSPKSILPGLLLASAALGWVASCGERPPSPTEAASNSTAQSTTPTTPPSKAKVRLGQGDAIALASDGKQLYVAGEDHQTLFIASLPLDPSSTPKAVELPGPPAQIVVAPDSLFVTIRTLPTPASLAARRDITGPFPPSRSPAPPRRTAFDKGTPKPDSRRGTAAKPLDSNIIRQSEGGLLLRMKPDAEKGAVETGRVVLPPDAWGLAVTPDGRRAVVTSAFSNRISVIDLDSMKTVESFEVAREPRGVAISPDGKTAYVTHLVGAGLSKLSDIDADPSLSKVELAVAPSRTPPGTKLTASLGYSATFSSDGRTLFVPRHALGATGTGAWWGAPTVDAMDVATETSLAPAAEAGSPKAWNAIQSERQYGTAAWTGLPGQAPPPENGLIQPRATKLRQSSNTLFVASEGSDAVAELDTRASDPAMFPIRVWSTGISYEHFNGYPTEGGAPSGLAFSEDESILFVYARSTFDIVAIDLTNPKTPSDLRQAPSEIVMKPADDTGRVYLRLADDGLPFDASVGRRLYFTARHFTVSGGMGCAGCHPDGRDDGHVWREGDFGEGKRFVGTREGIDLSRSHDQSAMVAKMPPLYPRQTPTIAGRVRANGPYGWHGENKDLLERLIHGFGLHRAPWNGSFVDKGNGTDLAIIDFLADYVRTGLIPPPTLRADLTEEEKRGQAIFNGQAQCSSCHVPESEYTDRKSYPLSAQRGREGWDQDPNLAFKTPTLRFIAGTAPYFHDGGAKSLEELIDLNGDRMGKTSNLPEPDKRALVAFLKTL